MNIKNIFNTNKIFIRFAFSYIFIICLTITLGVFAYTEVLKTSRSDSIREGMDKLEKGKDLIDSHFKDIENILKQMSMEESIQRMFYIHNPPSPSDYYRFYEVSNRMNLYGLTNGFIDRLYFILKEPDVIISSGQVGDIALDYYNEYMSYQDMDYNTWKEKVLSKYNYRSIWPRTSVTRQGNKSSMITYTQSYPAGSGSGVKGAFIMLVDETKLHQYLGTSEIMKDGWLFISDEKNQIITSINIDKDKAKDFTAGLVSGSGNEEKEINNEKLIVMHTTSSYLQWKYTAFLPTVSFESKANNIKRLFGLTALLIFLVGIVSALFFSYRNSVPIKRIIESLKENFNKDVGKGFREFDFIQGSVSKLIDNNNTLKSELEGQIPFVRSSLIERLLRGEFYKIHELEVAISYSKLDLHGDWFCVILVRVNGYNEELTEENIKDMTIARVIGNSVLEESVPYKVLLHNIDENKIAALVILNASDKQGFEEKLELHLEKIVNKLHDEYNIRVAFGIGNLYPDLINISRSFYEAKEALEYKNRDKLKKTIWFQKMPGESGVYFYPMDVELRLMNLTKTGNKAGVLSMLETIYNSNILQQKLSEKEITQLYFEIRGTIMKIKKEILIEDEREQEEFSKKIIKMDSFKDSESLFEYINEVYGFLCSTVNERKTMRNSKLSERIMKYLNDHYMESNLNLYKVASEFDLTEKYLSQFFKDQTSENFSTYIEKLRLEKAIELMKQTDLAINDIAISVGYDRINTFYRAFKRLYGVTPSTYKTEN